MAIIITILVGFANMIITTLQRSQITSSKTVIKNSDPPLMSIKVEPQNNFMMGFEIQGIDLSVQNSFLEFKFIKFIKKNGILNSFEIVPL